MLRLPVQTTLRVRTATALRRWFASLDVHKPINVLVGTQTGTAMSFANALRDAAEDRGVRGVVNVCDLADYDGVAPLGEGEQQAVFILACAGAGEPTDNARAMYTSLMQRTAPLDRLRFAVFGLGSSKTHKHNYNVVGKRVDEQLARLGAQRVYALGLGDDSAWCVFAVRGHMGNGLLMQCQRSIEADFHQWQEGFLDRLLQTNSASATSPDATSSSAPSAHATSPAQLSRSPSTQSTLPAQPSAQATSPAQPSPSPSAQPSDPYGIVLTRPVMCTQSFDDLTSQLLKERGFYKPQTMPMAVKHNTMLNPVYPDSMLEIALRVPDDSAGSVRYETGDHLGVYPANDPTVVEQLAARFNYPLDAVVSLTQQQQQQQQQQPTRKLPFPDGITVRDALSRCMELQWLPQPPTFNQLAACATSPGERARLTEIARKTDLYKDYVWLQNRHILDILDEFKSVHVPFANLVTMLPQLSPRFYSISSSALAHPSEVHLTYRWVHYTSKCGTQRQGVCTRYLKSRLAAAVPPATSTASETVVHAFLRPSSFRQPSDPSTPVIMIAGGSGIAPLKAFLEERHLQASAGGRRYGHGTLIFGVRSADDFVYKRLIDDCLRSGALTAAHISFSATSPARFAFEDVDAHGATIWSGLQQAGCLYLCGGASTFASTCGQALRRVFQTHGNMSAQAADEYLLKLIQEKRYFEDLAD